MHHFVENTLHEFSYYNHVCQNPIGKAGGLVVAWDNTVRLKVLHHDDNQINCSVWDEKSKLEWVLTCMYGSPYNDVRKDKSWQLVNEMGQTMNSSWIILGDLNVILSK